jgi:hypothetical protein
MRHSYELERKNMRSSGSSQALHSTRFGIEALVLLTVATLIGGAAAAAESEAGATNVWDALTEGKVQLDVRGRIEIADTTTTTQSEAYTIRTRLGYGTKPYYGVSAYVDFENISAASQSTTYRDKPSDVGSKTVIADPPDTELNQAYLEIAPERSLGTSVIGGRQRLILDDARFVGNVGWRQNEQTFDEAVLKTSLGVDGLQILYGYMWAVRRIFGNQAGDNPDPAIAASTLDFDSNSHIANISYSKLSFLKIAGFGYFLNFDNSAANSSNSVGTRLSGDIKMGDNLSLGYQGSYAFQWDGGSGAGENPTDYTAHYAMLDAKLAFEPVGAVGGGYELLGSDDGVAQFRTPLATAHKFNGWADRFLNNGGVNGLQDMYAYVAPKLPWGMKGKLVYHHFKSHEGGNTLGNELDAVLQKAVNKHFVVLAKAAYFNDAGNDAGHTVRGWLQATLKF